MQAPPRRLLVDGHNVLHAWAWLGRAAPVTGAGVATQRAQLVATLQPLHDVEGVEVTVVFDGREGSATTRDEAESRAGCAVVFAPAGLTADGVIERFVTAADDPRAYVVATADRLVRETVLAAGGDWLAPEDLAAWIERCRTRAARQAGTQTASAAKKFGNRLPL